MLTRIQAGPYSVHGVSVGGIYTSLSVPELGALFDVGIAPRSFVGGKYLFLSHGHADHVGAFNSLLGIRGLSHAPAPRTFLPVEIHSDFKASVDAMNRTQHRGLEVNYQPVSPGDEILLDNDLWVRVFRTDHTVPSVGYELFRRVSKLREPFLELSGPEIAERRRSGEDLFRVEERRELAYATDTLIDVLDHEPRLLQNRVLILECTFLDERKERDESRKRGHIHLDEILERADSFDNERLVLMHFSQLYSPREVHEILKRRCPPHLFERIVAFAPAHGPWPG